MQIQKDSSSLVLIRSFKNIFQRKEKLNAIKSYKFNSKSWQFFFEKRYQEIFLRNFKKFFIKILYPQQSRSFENRVHKYWYTMNLIIISYLKSDIFFGSFNKKLQAYLSFQYLTVKSAISLLRYSHTFLITLRVV